MERAREGKVLIDATRDFAVEDKLTSWWHFASTLFLLAAAVVGAAWQPHNWLGWVIRVGSSLVAAGLIVRGFILYHDHQHGALLRKSPVARAVFWLYGVLLMTPPPVWRETHNYHHAHTAKIVASHVGSYAMVTTSIWASMSPKERMVYKIIRHPLTILFAYWTLFMYGMGVSPFLRNKKKHWASLASVAFNWALSGLLIWKLGVVDWVFAMLLPLALAMAVGGYLFYAQHNFPETFIQPRDKWTYTRAALESSSYMTMGPVMRFFCGNIGFHHVHHLNSSIPFYRLPEAMEAIPELQDPPTTSLAPKDIVTCFRLKLWDPDTQRMVGYPEAQPKEAEASS